MAAVGLRRNEGLSTVSYRLSVAAPLLLLLTAFALFLLDLNSQSFWRDEALSVLRARQPWSEQWRNLNIIDGAAGPDLHPPLYFMLLKLWSGLLGESEFALRLFSAFSQIMALAALARLAGRIEGRFMSAATLLLAVLSPYLWWYAGEARMYAFLFLLGTLTLSQLWQVGQSEPTQPWRYGWPLILAILATAVHYSGAFLLAFVCLVLLLRLRRRLLLGGVGSGLLLVVVLLSLTSLDDRLFEFTFAGLSFSAWQRIIEDALRTFSLGSSQADFNASWALLPFLLLAAASLWGGWQAWWHRSQWLPAAFSGAGFLLMSLIFWSGGIIQVAYANPRHLTLLAPFWFLLLGYGAATLWRLNRLVSLILLTITAAAGASALNQAITAPPQIRDDMRGLSQFLEPRLQAGDRLVVHDAAMMAIYEIYALPELPARAIPATYVDGDAAIRASFREFTAGQERIWFISGLQGDSGVTDILRLEWVRQEMVSFDAAWSGLHLSLYTRALRDGAVPDEAIGLDPPLANGSITIHGALLEPTATGHWWTLYWARPGDQPPPADSTTCLRLTDTDGTVWSEQCLQLFHQRANRGEALYRRQFWLPLPDGLPPLDYVVNLDLPNGRHELTTIAAAPSQSNRAEGPLMLTAAANLRAFSWAAASFRAGGWALGDLLWEAPASAATEASVDLRLVDWLGRTVQETSLPLGPGIYPAAAWQPGELVRQPIAMELPFTLAGDYRLQLRLAGSGWQTVGETHIEGWPKLTELPAEVVPAPNSYELGDNIELLAYEGARAGDQLQLRFYWRSDSTVDGNAVVFVHIGAAGQPPSAQTSSGPAGWTRPLYTWRAGEIIVDEHRLNLPPDLPDDLGVWVGMFPAEEPNNRLPVAASGEPVRNNLIPLGRLADFGS